MRRLTLIRHGLTEGNVRRWYYGALDLPLCEAGQAAVQEAAAGGLYPPYSGERILTSGMLRTEQTLRLIYGEAPHEIWPELRRSASAYSRKVLRAEGLGGVRGMAGDWFWNVPPGGESFAQAEARIFIRAWPVCARRTRDLLAVVHGGTVLTIMQALFPEEEKSGYDWQPRPGGGYRIDLTAHCYEQIGLL